MARCNDQQCVRKIALQDGVGREHDLVFALVRGGCEPDWACADFGGERCTRGRVNARGGRCEFEIARRTERRGAESGECVLGAFVGGGDVAERADEATAGGAPVAPAA